MSNGGCNFDPLSLVNCYPVVTDPLNETFLSIHLVSATPRPARTF